MDGVKIKIVTKKFLFLGSGLLGLLLFVALPAQARDLLYTGSEQTIYVKPGEPTQVSFPSKIEGGFKRKQSSLALERQGDNLIVFAQPTLSSDGEAIIVHLDDKRSYNLRVQTATPENPRDSSVRIEDERPPEMAEGAEPQLRPETPRRWLPPTEVAGLMREMILVAEFGLKKGVAGYRRSNRFSGETVLNDGAMNATVDEIFMGPDFWGYVLNVENMLQTTQRINPATFRLDGTRAVAAQRWELAPQPLTEEQRIANAHTGKLYIITQPRRR